MGRTNGKWLRRFCPVSFLHLERNSHAENVECEPLSTGPVGDGLLVSDCMAGSSVPLQGFALEGVATGMLATKLAMRTWKHSEDWQLDPYVLVSVSNKVIQFSLILGVRMQTINRNNIRNGGVQIYSKQTMGVGVHSFPRMELLFWVFRKSDQNWQHGWHPDMTNYRLSWPRILLPQARLKIISSKLMYYLHLHRNEHQRQPEHLALSNHHCTSYRGQVHSAWPDLRRERIWFRSHCASCVPVHRGGLLKVSEGLAARDLCCVPGFLWVSFLSYPACFLCFCLYSY